MIKLILKNKIESSDRIPPKAAQDAAKKVLEWKDKHGSEVKGMTETGWRRARQIASGKALSLDIIKKISQFSRHEKNKTVSTEYKSTPWRDNGYVAWLGWGGDSAILQWSKKVLEKDKKQNAVDNPKLKARTYSCRFLEDGVVQYDDEMVLIKNGSLMRIAEKFKGIPVIIEHKDFGGDYDGELNVGYISRVYKNDEDGWAWCDFVIDNEEAIRLIEDKGYSVSCAYIPTESGEGGVYHSIPYDREILDGEPLHLALVENPRYEDAIILKNSISGKKMIFKLKKAEKAKQEAKENEMKDKVEEKEIDIENSVIEMEGEKISVKDMIEAYKNRKHNEEEEEKENVLNEEDEIEIDGEKIKVSELKDAYNECKKANEEKENAEDEEKKEAAKQNSFKKIKDAKKKSDDEAYKNSGDKKSAYVSSADAIAQGRIAYGSAQKVEK